MVRQGWDPLQQPVDEARDPVGGELLENTEVDEELDDGRTRPVVRAAEDAGVEDAQRRERAKCGVAWREAAVRPAARRGAGGLAGVGVGARPAAVCGLPLRAGRR